MVDLCRERLFFCLYEDGGNILFEGTQEGNYAEAGKKRVFKALSITSLLGHVKLDV